jgi:hypothetical protein
MLVELMHIYMQSSLGVSIERDRRVQVPYMIRSAYKRQEEPVSWRQTIKGLFVRRLILN